MGYERQTESEACKILTKHWCPCTKLYGITSQKTVMFTCTNVKTSNVSSYLHFFSLHSNSTKASVSIAVYIIITYLLTYSMEQSPS